MPETKFKKKTATGIILGALVLAFALLLLLLPSTLDGPDLGRLVFSNGQMIVIEIADTEIKRVKGLSGRRAIDEDYGMLFLFEEPNVPAFWMKGMNFEIDMIWILNDTVVDIEKNVPLDPGFPPILYSPDQPVNTVLEVKAGFSDRYGVNVGDTIDFFLPKK